MENRELSIDTKTYNLYQKYLDYKKLNYTGRVQKYIIFDYPEEIEVGNVETVLRLRDDSGMLRKKITKKIKIQTSEIHETKGLYQEFYSPEKVNIPMLSEGTFTNIINDGKDDVLSFAINYNFTKCQFKLTHNPTIFQIQDGMFDYMSENHNITKLYEWIDELSIYNKATKFIANNTSAKYNSEQKIEKLLKMRIEKLEDMNYKLQQNKNDLKIAVIEQDIKNIDNCNNILKDKDFRLPILYKAKLLLNKNIINIDSLDIAKKVIRYSDLK